MSADTPSSSDPQRSSPRKHAAPVPPRSRSPLRLLTLIGSPLAVLALGYLTFTEIRAEQEAREAAQGRQAVLLQFHEIRTHLNTVENAVRRFAMTGDPVQLAAKDTATVRLHEALAELRELVPTPEGRGRVDALEPILAAILTDADRLVAAYATGNLEEFMTEEAVRRRRQMAGLAQSAFQAFETDTSLAVEPSSRRHWLVAFLAVSALLSASVALLLSRSYRRSDQTAKELAEKHVMLQRQEAYVRTVVDSVPDVLFAQDAAGCFQMANRATAEILGLPEDQILGRLHRDVSTQADDVERLAQQVRQVLESGEANSVIRRILHPITQEERWFETRVVPLNPPAGGNLQALVVGTDHTDRFRAEQIIRSAQQEMLTRLAEAAEFRDGETGLHTRRVAFLAAEIARMIGMSDEDVELVAQAAPLHDVGKIGIPDSILLKPGALSEIEFQVMKTHTLIGAKLLEGGASKLMKTAETICLMHHERWDGSGYPAGLREDETPPIAQVVWVADVVDALGHARPYRSAWPLSLIIQELRNQRGKKYNPITLDACLELLTAPDGEERWLEDPTSTPIRSITTARRRENGDSGRARRA